MSRIIPVLLLLPCLMPAADRQTAELYATSGQRLIPHYAAGGAWTTRVRVTNPTPVLQRFRLASFDTAGNPQTLLYSGASANQTEKDVPAHGVVDVVLTSSEGLKTGMLTLDFLLDPRLKLPVTVFFRTTDPYNTEGAVSWESSAQLLTSFVQFDNTSGGQTGIAVADVTPVPSGVGARVEMDCFNEFGTNVGFMQVLAAGKQQNAFDLGSNLAGTVGVKGLCVFTYTSNSTVPSEWSLSVLSLQFKGVNFLPLK